MSQPKAKKGSGKRAGSIAIRTSDSVSASKITSSLCGTPTPTAGTASQVPDKVNGAMNAGTFQRVAAKIGSMSGAEFRASLLRAGIITTKGTLKSKYRKK